jgi:hypothetical protein
MLCESRGVLQFLKHLIHSSSPNWREEKEETMKRVSVCAVAFLLLLSMQAMGQNAHLLDVSSLNERIMHQVYCNVPTDHKTVNCSISVSPTMYGPSITHVQAYLLRNLHIIPLNVTSSFLGYQSESVAIYKGDTLDMEWDGGRFAYQIGKNWTPEQWAGYVQRLTALCDWELSPEGRSAFQQQFQRDMGISSGGGGFARPCSVVRDQINRVQHDIDLNNRALDATSGSIWNSGVQGTLSQNRQRLSDLQSELANCTQ